MKKFVLKSFVFLLPVILLFGFNKIFYVTDKGDLIRLGYVMSSGLDKYKELFKEEYDQAIHFTNISDLNLKTENKFTVLTIGDSFSEQANFGYKNYLAQNKRIKVLHYDKFLNDNPLETVWGILKGDVLQNLKIKYIVLQSVEREMVYRAVTIKKNKSILIDSLKNDIANFDLFTRDWGTKDNLFSKTVIKFPLTNLGYLMNDNAFTSKVYKVQTTKQLFSTSKKQLLFYAGDKNRAVYNSSLKSIMILNKELNILSNALGEKGIKLIVLPSPDKFSIYYEFISNKKNYPKPLFFENLRKMKKNYSYIDAKHVLSKLIEYEKDVYFYDDSHWSPIASKAIAKELERVIN